MGSYCCIKTTKTQKNSSIKLDELPKKSDSFILNLKNEYLPPNKGLNPDLRNLYQNQSNVITKTGTFEKRESNKNIKNLSKKKTKDKEICKFEININKCNNNNEPLTVIISDLDYLKTNKCLDTHLSDSLNIHRRRKAFELLPLKGKNCLSSSPQNIIQLNFFDSDEEVYIKAKTIEKSKNTN